MYQFDRIKLVIWDLDETFWKGTISEGAVEIPQRNCELLARLTDIGVVNSICSKNDYETAMAYLRECDLAKYFVPRKACLLPLGLPMRAHPLGRGAGGKKYGRRCKSAR